MSTEVRVTLNGSVRGLAPGETVADLVAELGWSRGVAVAVDGAVVPRSEWAARLLSEGESIEVVTAVQGG